MRNSLLYRGPRDAPARSAAATVYDPETRISAPATTSTRSKSCCHHRLMNLLAHDPANARARLMRARPVRQRDITAAEAYLTALSKPAPPRRMRESEARLHWHSPRATLAADSSMQGNLIAEPDHRLFRGRPWSSAATPDARRASRRARHGTRLWNPARHRRVTAASELSGRLDDSRIVAASLQPRRRSPARSLLAVAVRRSGCRLTAALQHLRPLDEMAQLQRGRPVDARLATRPHLRRAAMASWRSCRRAPSPAPQALLAIANNDLQTAIAASLL